MGKIPAEEMSKFQAGIPILENLRKDERRKNARATCIKSWRALFLRGKSPSLPDFPESSKAAS
jgi:hypothetical protein